MKTYWYVDFNSKSIKECVLKQKHNMITFIKDNGEFESWSQGYKSNDLFEEKKDALDRLEYLNDLYFNTFKYKPFLREERLLEHLEELKYIEAEIESKLSDYENFQGIDFCDVSAGGIQIRGHHKEIKGYTYGDQPTISYDFYNYRDCIDEFVEMWKVYDTPDRIKREKDFIADGEKYGWD